MTPKVIIKAALTPAGPYFHSIGTSSGSIDPSYPPSVKFRYNSPYWDPHTIAMKNKLTGRPRKSW